jgi:hypothetical protein
MPREAEENYKKISEYFMFRPRFALLLPAPITYVTPQHYNLEATRFSKQFMKNNMVSCSDLADKIHLFSILSKF